MKKLAKGILKLLGAKIILKICQAIYGRLSSAYDYRLRLVYDVEFFKAENFRHWNHSTDVRRTSREISDTEKQKLNRRSHELVQETLAPFLQPNMEILDYGSGLGDSVAYYKEQGFAVVGAELSEALRSYAQEQYGVISITPEQLFAENIYKERFNLIYTQAVLQYIHPKELLRFHHLLASRLLPGGQIVHISCPVFKKRHLLFGSNAHKLATTAALPLYITKPPTFFVCDQQLQDVALLLGFDFQRLPEPEWFRRHHPETEKWYRSSFSLTKNHKN